MRKRYRDKELVSQLCVTFYWNRKSKEVNGTKKEGVRVGSYAVSGHLAPEVSFSRSWMPSLSIKRTLKEGRLRMKRLLSWRRDTRQRETVKYMDGKTSKAAILRKRSDSGEPVEFLLNK